ncbi:MAG: hypothetical protein A2231_06000 [Candidatus Firestonebacteria bacterium RIFOXYA2_FULL_40_8]|nr:MAG: hypothetical protein A2231_06000 [Candidatus Firestonebacteria bacterium RIFOXYA2_FULL_40_8]
MKKRSTKIIFLVYFLTLFLSFALPFFITGGFWVHFVHYSTILLLFSLGVLLAILNKIEIFEIKKREKEKQENLSAFTEELIDAYKHLGTVNRQLEMIKGLIGSSAFSHEEINRANLNKVLLNNLSSVVASIRAKWGVLRFIDVEKGKTLSQFVFAPKGAENTKLPKIDNSDLIDYLKEKKWHPKLFFVTPDEKDRRFVVLIILPKTKKLLEIDDTFLRIFTNQAQLIFTSFSEIIINGDKKK